MTKELGPYDHGFDDGFNISYRYVIDYLSAQLENDLADTERRLIEDLLDHFEINLDSTLF